jgi:hypothetical protein
LISDHLANGKIDAIGFTTYPYLEYDAPSDIPDDYYSDLLNYTGSKAVIYSEIGWIATNAVSPYNGSEALQAAFVDRFFTLNQNVDMGYAVWLFLYDFTDYTGIEAFTDIGLRNNDGSAIRQADGVWQDYAALAQ